MSTDETNKQARDILFSEKVLAGKRIYYIDVKQNSKGDDFLVITESKKISEGSEESATTSFQKHKIFLYKEDFGKFMHALQSALSYIEENESVSE